MPYFYSINMKLKIFFGDKALHLCDNKDEEISELLHHPDTIFIDELSSHAIHAMLHEIKKENFHAGVLLHNDIEELKKEFFRHFTCIEAAGGIVLNSDKEILMIFRKGKWDLPKGKMEENENPDLCAEREIAEETGAQKLTLRKKIGVTYHSYEEFGKHILKTTHWFFFTCPGEENLTPQTEEDITDVRWIPAARIAEPMKNTYESIREILTVFFNTP